MPSSSKYLPLGDYLAARAAAGARRVTLSFGQIEGEILRAPLPPAARSRRWWANSPATPQAWWGWLRVGWHAAGAQLTAERVTFRHIGDHDED